MKKWIFCILFIHPIYTHAALNFSNQSYITVPNSSTFSSTNTISISAWVKGLPQKQWTYVLAKSRNAAAGSFAFDSGKNKGFVFYITVNGIQKESSDYGLTFWDNNWHFAVGIYTGTSVRLFVDNVEIGTAKPASGAITYNSNTLQIGAYDPAIYPGYFTGSVDDVRIYNMVLSTETIDLLFTTKQRFQPVENMTAWWKLNDVATGVNASPFFIFDSVGTNSGVIKGNSIIGEDSILFDLIVSTNIPSSVYVLNQDQMNGIKQEIWANVFKSIANLRPEVFSGIAAGDWAVNASTGKMRWSPVNIDTVTGYGCFISSPSAQSWDDIFKLNLDNALLEKSWDDVTWPLTEFDSINDVEDLNRFK